jgi:hypothetical protein
MWTGNAFIAVPEPRLIPGAQVVLDDLPSFAKAEHQD